MGREEALPEFFKKCFYPSFMFQYYQRILGSNLGQLMDISWPCISGWFMKAYFCLRTQIMNNIANTRWKYCIQVPPPYLYASERQNPPQQYRSFWEKQKLIFMGRGFSFDAVLDNTLSCPVVTEARMEDGDEASLCSKKCTGTYVSYCLTCQLPINCLLMFL